MNRTDVCPESNLETNANNVVSLFFFILPKTMPFGLVKAKATAALIVFSSFSFHFLFLFVLELISRDKTQLQNP